MRVTFLFGVATCVQSIVCQSLNTEASVTDKNKSVWTQPMRNVPGKAKVRQCDLDKKQLLNVQEVSVLLTGRPKIGESYTVTAFGHLDEDIGPDAYVQMEFRYGGIVLFDKRYDVCALAKEVGHGCPIEKGQYLISRSMLKTQNAPPGTYRAVVRAYTADHRLITCLAAEQLF